MPRLQLLRAWICLLLWQNALDVNELCLVQGEREVDRVPAATEPRQIAHSGFFGGTYEEKRVYAINPPWNGGAGAMMILKQMLARRSCYRAEM